MLARFGTSPGYVLADRGPRRATDCAPTPTPSSPYIYPPSIRGRQSRRSLRSSTLPILINDGLQAARTPPQQAIPIQRNSKRLFPGWEDMWRKNCVFLPAEGKKPNFLTWLHTTWKEPDRGSLYPTRARTAHNQAIVAISHVAWARSFAFRRAHSLTTNSIS